MKKIFRFITAISIVVILFSCTHKRYPQTAAKSSSKTPSPYFLFISDIHLDISQQKTDSTTDTGFDLWDSFKLEIDSILGSSNPPRFVICTGDLSGHDDCDGKCRLKGLQLEKRIAELRATLTDLRNIVSKHKIQLYFAPGNNDAISGDYYSFADDKGQTPFSFVPDLQNPYPALNVADTGRLIPCLLSMPHPSMGYYAALATPELRIIALNTVIFNSRYKSVDNTTQIDAGNEEMQWLSLQLKEASTQKQKVYIIMHIPPGSDAYKMSHHKTPHTTWAELPSFEHSWLNSFLDLTTTYQTIIAGIFYGHTHMDELRILYDSTENPTAVAISAPGLTPQHGNNPGFKIVNYNSVTMAVTDFTTYYTTLPVTGKWSSYKFSNLFNKKNNNISIFDFIKTQPVELINKNMDQIYTVMHGKPTYSTAGGLLVKYK